MISAILSRIVILVLGTLYPAYASYKAVKTRNVKEYVKWMMYWIVFALFTIAETLADMFVSWLPFYYELKIVFVLWLLSPATNGSSILYRKFVHPQLSKREKEIDNMIETASAQGYSAVLNLGSRGISYAANVLVSTAVKGQARLVDHVKKSYSVGDISLANSSADFVDNQERVEDSDDDELDNRRIAEQYNLEVAEMTAASTGSAQQPSSDREPLYPLQEMEELPNIDVNKPRGTRTKKAMHTDAAHYATLPRSSARARSSRSTINKVNV